MSLRLSAAGGRARIEVSDRGPGIAAAELARVFTPFYRGPHTSGLHKSGLGLGLHITSAIVSRHGGEIRVASAPGAGCTFTVELPQ